MPEKKISHSAVVQPSISKPAPAGKILVFTAPSGAGKTTLVRHLLGQFPDKLAFSVSATTREPREHETHGEDYYFLSQADFRDRIKTARFLEYEEVYEGQYYGTLRAEIERVWAEGKAVVFDVEVKGASAIKAAYPDAACVVFVSPPSPEVLFARLRGRGTEDEDSLKKRIARAGEELTYRDRFDYVLVNDDLDEAKQAAEDIALYWLGQ
ncbi:MAG: guanylate kinase [Saprospiraceae bacterium]